MDGAGSRQELQSASRKDSLEQLDAVLIKVLELVRDHPCECKVTGQGLQRCRRCLILSRRYVY